MTGQVVILGGAVLDLHARPVNGSPLQPGGTVPGHVRQVPGGVSRNIAECMAHVGRQRPLLVSVVGQDVAAEALKAGLHAAGLQSHALTSKPGIATASCLTLVDADGEVAGAVADVAGMDCLLPEDVRRHATNIQAAPLVLLDGNLPAGCLQEAASIASDAGVPVWYEPTSVPKSSRALPILRNITFTSPNAKELVAMANGLRAAGGLAALPVSAGMAEVSLDDPPGSPTGSSGQGMVRLRLQALLPHIKTLLQEGVLHIVLTLGSAGAACLVAGCVDALLRGLGPGQALAFGVAAAKHAAESLANVPLGISPAALEADARQAIQQLTRWDFPSSRI
ncbi:hypothetical protein WJX84_008108 [Apatococcus fuscideae]|uniref:Carbohydrate kinase PfkB domain-containing protein n=1 Tax=Apatococcus fuscideae TaxID=2026836 RepID=A0AAW1T7E5_9CHLO